MKPMTKSKVWMLAILFISFLVVSCDKEPDPVAINEAEVLVQYLESPASPAANYGNSGLALKAASAVNELLGADKVTVIDIRSAADFATGHIEGAVNLAAADVRDYIDGLASYDEISIVCYTGQTASWLTSLLQLAGYHDVYSLGFGMSSWAADFDKWTSNCSNEKATLFEASANDKAAEGDLPTLTTGFETAEEIFDARWDAVLAEGFGAAAISSTAVYDNLDDYYILNYWPEADYTGYGHIEGAIQYTPNVDLALDEALKTLPTDKTIVVYCYTGQNSARIACYLRILGYDARSLKFGANGMIYDELTAHKWVASGDYAWVSSK